MHPMMAEILGPDILIILAIVAVLFGAASCPSWPGPWAPPPTSSARAWRRATRTSPEPLGRGRHRGPAPASGGSLLSLAMAGTTEEAPERVLAVYAHPDDPEVSCGGALARWARAGAEVHVAICASGDKGTVDPATDPAELVKRRVGEMDAAATVLGLAGHHRLDHPDGELAEAADLRPQLVALVRSPRPDP